MSADLDNAPIFIGGVAGAGKTRLGTALDRHPRIAVTRKTYLWRNFYGRYGDLADPKNLRRCVADILRSPGVVALRLDAECVWNRATDGPPTYGHVFGVVHALHASAQGKPRWCDQLGLAEVHAKPIFDAYPRARMIHMVCHPGSLPAPDGPPGTLGWMVGKWLTSAELARRNADTYGDRYLVVRIEDLHADERRTLSEICDFLGEGFDPSLVRDPAPDPSPPVREPDVGLDPFVALLTAGAMANLGYEPASPARSSNLRHRLVDRTANTMTLKIWRRVKLPSMSKGRW